MGHKSGNGSGKPDRIRVTWPDDSIDGGLGFDARSPGPLWVLPMRDGVRRISVRDEAQPPVFILSVARSGSTLLRFILDSHPDLACPPETNVGQVCFGLARLWDLLEPSPESASDSWRPNVDPAQLPAEAIRAIRAAVDGVYGRYLARHGKPRWCDKSLDSAQMAELLVHVYPEAQFICLYRHCLDVVVSAIDAAPWGLSGYGFDSYVAATPGNAVLAAARGWLDQTRAITEFQEKHPDRCHGVRYEDLVTSPEQVAADLLTFLGVDPVPGITETCLRRDHEIRGAADHKIWFTSRISTASLGQGARVPIGMLPPEFLSDLNETLGQLDYRQVDEQWRATGPADPRAGGGPAAAPGEPTDAAPDATPDAGLDAVATEIARRLASVSEHRLRELARRWPATRSNLVIAVQPPDGARPSRCWTVSCAGSALTICQGESQGEASATVLAAPDTWQALLDGQANLAAEQRAGRLRLLDGSAEPHTEGPANFWAGMHLIAHLLGLAGSSQSPRADQQANVLL
jgi:protein-tyrosine sulfotransferase